MTEFTGKSAVSSEQFTFEHQSETNPQLIFMTIAFGASTAAPNLCSASAIRLESFSINTGNSSLFGNKFGNSLIRQIEKSVVDSILRIHKSRHTNADACDPGLSQSRIFQ